MIWWFSIGFVAVLMLIGHFYRNAIRTNEGIRIDGWLILTLIGILFSGPFGLIITLWYFEIINLDKIFDYFIKCLDKDIWEIKVKN